MNAPVFDLIPAIAERLTQEDFAVQEIIPFSGGQSAFLMFRDGRLHLVLLQHANAECSRQIRSLQRQFQPHFTHVVTVLEDAEHTEVDWGGLAAQFRCSATPKSAMPLISCDKWGHLQHIPR